jgi:hypothetical protein
MFHARTRTGALSAHALLLLAALALLPSALAQTNARKPAPAPARNAQEEQPPFSEYKGVRIGMSADEARKLLGNPTDKDDKQEVFAFENEESCQVYYDNAKKVTAFYVTFLSSKGVPTAKAVLGEQPEAKQDGSFSKLIRFPKAGFWVSYTRTSGDTPMIIIAMQKIDP